MNILLMTSPPPPSGMSPFSTKEKLMPLGVGYLAAVARDAGHQTDFVDLYVNDGRSVPDYSAYDFVALTSNTVCFRGTMQLLNEAKLARKRGWEGKVVVGGPHAAVAPETIPDVADYIVQGEGEEAILEILNNSPSERIISKPRIENLDALPLPAYDLFSEGGYDTTTDMIPEAKNVFSYSTSRGCPFACSFCSSKNIWGRKYTYKSPERVVEDLEILQNKYDCDSVYFREDNFTIRRDRVLSICDGMRSKGLNLLWATESRVDTLDRELLEEMYAAGCRGLYFGVEAGNDSRMATLSKGISVEQVRDVFRISKEIGFFRYASFIIDTPDESLDDRKDIFRLVDEIRPDKTGFNHFTALPGSELYEEVVKKRAYLFVDDIGLVHMPSKEYPNLVDLHTDQKKGKFTARIKSVIRCVFR